jgi:uncharacterized protein YjbI with pentapeptide repeats
MSKETPETNHFISDELPLPAIAAQADDLDSIKKSVEDAAAISGSLWLSYLFGIFYIALAAAGVTHADLLLQNPVELPFLTIKLPLKAFFILSPILFVISHAYTLAHFALLGDKAKRFHAELRKKIDGGHQNAHDIREGLRQQLPINMFVQFLAGPEEIREGPFSGLLWMLAWTSLVLGPIMVLLLLQLQFLPYHDSGISWEHRIILALDLGLIWWLWMKLLSGRSEDDKAGDAKNAASVGVGADHEKKRTALWTRFKENFLWVSRYLLAKPLTVVIVLFSWWIATYPGEWQEGPYALAPSLEWTAANKAVFGEIDAQRGKITGNWPLNTLRLAHFNIQDVLKSGDHKQIEKKDHILDLHYRRLENADFRLAKFGDVDLRGAHLEGAILFGAELQGASILNAHMRGALLDLAHLKHAKLGGAELQGASLLGTELQGAWLVAAQLQGATLDSAHIQGASLFKAQLQGASINGAELLGSLLTEAQLQGASLLRADLRGASLEMADLRGSSFENARLEGVEFSRSSQWRNKFSRLEQGKFRLMEAESTSPSPGVDAPGKHWTELEYESLRSQLENSIPKGELKDKALERIKILDCRNPDKSLAPCDPTSIPREPAQIRGKGDDDKASLDDASYEKVLVEQLRAVICSIGPDAILILEGILTSDVISENDLANLNRSMGADSGEGNALARLAANARVSRLTATGREAPVFIDFIMSKGCPVSAALSENDKAKLLEIKAEIDKHFPRNAKRE